MVETEQKSSIVRCKLTPAQCLAFWGKKVFVVLFVGSTIGYAATTQVTEPPMVSLIHTQQKDVAQIKEDISTTKKQIEKLQSTVDELTEITKIKR